MLYFHSLTNFIIEVKQEISKTIHFQDNGIIKVQNSLVNTLCETWLSQYTLYCTTVIHATGAIIMKGSEIIWLFVHHDSGTQLSSYILFDCADSSSTYLSKMLLYKLSCFMVEIFASMLFCKVSNTNCICGVKLPFQEHTACIDDISDL